jgi:hypothetical protein
MSIYLSCNGVFAWGFLRFAQQSLDFFVKFDEIKRAKNATFAGKEKAARRRLNC